MTDVADLASSADDEGELLLGFLCYLRKAVLRKLNGLNDEQAHWHPEGKLLPVIGVVNHLTHVEWRWIDGGMLGEAVSRSEEEFFPPALLTVADATSSYRAHAERTDSTVRAIADLEAPCGRREGTNLRWVLLHLINETARHAGHADATRELLDGVVGE